MVFVEVFSESKRRSVIPSVAQLAMEPKLLVMHSEVADPTSLVCPKIAPIPHTPSSIV